MREMLHAGARFLLVGALSTAIELASFNLLVFAFGWDVVSAKVVSSLIALVNAYFGNREWAFRHRKGRGRWLELGLFLAVNAVCTVLGAAIVALGARLLGTDHALLLNLVNITSIGIVVLVRFALYHYVVFRGESPTAAAAQDADRPAADERTPVA